MRKLAVTSLVFLMVLLVGSSCSKDDDSSAANTAASIEGKWQYSQVGELINNKEVLKNYEHLNGCTKDYMELLKSSDYKEHWFENPNCKETTETGTWVKNNNTLVFTFSNEIYSYEILELTNTTLKIKMVESGVTYFEVYTRI